MPITRLPSKQRHADGAAGGIAVSLPHTQADYCLLLLCVEEALLPTA